MLPLLAFVTPSKDVAREADLSSSTSLISETTQPLLPIHVEEIVIAGPDSSGLDDLATEELRTPLLLSVDTGNAEESVCETP